MSILSVFASLVFFASAVVAQQPVPELDTERYLGRWQQAYSDFAVEATFENSSQCVTADQGQQPNGTISVENRERNQAVDGPERRILGWAAAPNASQPGELVVNLQTTHFGAPYWIYELGPPTQNGSLQEYSIVSDPFKLTLFVLARNLTTFAEEQEQGVLANLTAWGFSGFLNTPIATVQKNCTQW